MHCSARPLPPPREPFMWLSGLEDLVVTKERFQFLNVGERWVLSARMDCCVHLLSALVVLLLL